MFREIATSAGDASAGHPGGMQLGAFSGANNVVTGFTKVIDRLLDIIQRGLAAFDQRGEISQRGGVGAALFTDSTRNIDNLVIG